MILTYDEYESQDGSLKFIEFQRIHFLMRQEMGEDEKAIELYKILIETATDYARMRSLWSINDSEWRLRNKESRTRIRNSLINRLNMLCRYLERLGKEMEWKKELGDAEKDPENKKRIGDFGCYLAFVHGLSAR